MYSENRKIEIIDALGETPQGQLRINHCTADDSQSILLRKHFASQQDGRGRMDIYPLYPGMELSMSWYQASSIRQQHDESSSILEITYCRSGRIGWDMKGSVSFYLGEGDMVLHRMDCCAQSTMTLPLGFFEGIHLSLDLEILAAARPEILALAGIDPGSLYRKLCPDGTPRTIPACAGTEHIFSMLYDLPPQMRIPYFKLKSQEVLLYLAQLAPQKADSSNQYPSCQVELIRNIHTRLTQDMERRYTIEELAKEYLINTSSLKAIFKAVYGEPIATYMKEYRIHQSLKFLRDTDDSIAAVAAKVGYESQSKFTRAFKERMGILPTVYRRQNRHPALSED